MPTLRATHVEIYVFARRGRSVRFLALRRAPGRRVLPGVWQPVTGKRDRGERALDAARREVAEETGLRPRRWWVLETLTVYFDAQEDAVMALPLFAAEVPADAAVRLSEEHDKWAFLSPAAAGRRYLWASQRRGLEAVRREVLGPGALARALEIPPAQETPRRRRAGPPAPRRRTRGRSPGRARA